jgi:citrate lyase subunit beta/citryl-CoA lyase
MNAPPRSLLFVPGQREKMLAKAATLPADAIVFDLEDSVPPAEKAAAREMVAAALGDWPAQAPRPYVRVNAPRDGQVAEDVAAVLAHPTCGVLVPKVDRPVELLALFDAFGGRARELLVNIETPRALLHVEEFADTPGVAGLFLGGEDLTLALGARRTPEGGELSWPRYLLLVAARAAGIAAFDAIHPEFSNLAVFQRDCEIGAAAGFDGKFAIHPAQLPAIHAAYTPDADAIAHAQRVVTVYDAAMARGEGAVAIDGQMIDPPVAERARALLRRARPTNAATK